MHIPHENLLKLQLAFACSSLTSHSKRHQPWWIFLYYIWFHVPVNSWYMHGVHYILKPMSVLNKSLTVCEQQVLMTGQVLLYYIIHMAVQSKATSCFKTVYSIKQWWQGFLHKTYNNLQNMHDYWCSNANIKKCISYPECLVQCKLIIVYYTK